MTLSPSNLLQRLKELRMWQESHEELLKKTKNAVNTSANVTTASDYQTIDGLSAFDSTLKEDSLPKTQKNWESLAISPTKTFNELLEEKLAEDPGPGNVTDKPKKPFLKKGSGLQRFRQTPTQTPAAAKHKIRKNSNATPLRAPTLSIKHKATWCKTDDSNDHIKKINEMAQFNSEPSEQTLYEKALEKELRIFEALEQKAENSSFCSTNSSVVRILSSTPSKIQTAEEKRVHWQPQSEDDDVIESSLEKHDIAEILLRLRNLAGAPTKVNNIPSIAEVSEDEKWSSTEPSSEDTSLSLTDFEATLKTQTRDIAISTDEQSGTCTICGEKLEQKISEYEKRVQEVIQDKNRIIGIRKELEQKERNFAKKMRELEDEKKNLLFDLEIEKKKLTKEKQVYQTYIKDSQNRPNKKERDEIRNLKQEVADLTETLKLKESKNGMTQARLRNQIKQLEKENSNLKDEAEKLTKENARISAAQKLNRRPCDAKILQEISKNVSKLAQTSKSKKTDESNEGEEKQKKSKQLDQEDSFLQMETTQKGPDIEVQYNRTFRNESWNNRSADKMTTKLEDGTTLVKYSNGNVKTVAPDGNFITVKYFNGDVQETNLLEGTIKYFFCNKNIWQTSFANGMELVEFPDGVKEKRHADGKREVTLPDGMVQINFPDGTQQTQYADGSVVNIAKNGDKELLLPNGQKEIETKEYKKREYPDGTIKILYPDGTLETKYANGRLRIKDSNGVLVLDTQ